MKWWMGVLLGMILAGSGMGVGYVLMKNKKAEPIIKEYPLLKYSIENLSKREYKSEIVLDEEVGEGVYRFHFDSDGKRVNGVAHIPGMCGRCPVVAQLRGYQEVSTYKSGNGTGRTAEKFAEAGFISLAPDFLGYGGSASPSADVFEARFETYTTALNLLAGIEKWDKTKNIGVWGHSNGGQIALAVAEVKSHPTVLWAPVSANFPYSILYYTDDDGKLLRKELAKFEEDYDTDLFSPANYLERIKAPVLIQQGTADELVPYKWNRKLGERFEYVEYPGADHNLMPSWNEAVKADIEFYKKYWYKL